MKMNHANRKSLANVITILAVLALLPGLNPATAAGGPLNPPGGIPDRTMKSLQEIEPRVPLDVDAPDTDAVMTSEPNHHFIIQKPGSYYLQDNFNSKKPAAILINSPHVTLDLNGFHLTTTENASQGIGVAFAAHDCRIFNGNISGFETGVRAVSILNPGAELHPQHVTLEHLKVSGASLIGIEAGQRWLVNNCTVRDSGVGMTAWGGTRFENCLVANCEDKGFVARENGVIFANCHSVGNRQFGIQLTNECTVENCLVTGTLTMDKDYGDGIDGGDGNRVTNTTVADNSGSGISLGNGNQLRDVLAKGNGSRGITVGDACAIANAKSISNEVTGIVAGIGSVIKGSESSRNAATGIDVGQNSQVLECVTSENEGRGIRAGMGVYISGVLSKGNGTNGLFMQGGVLEKSSFISNGASGVDGSTDFVIRDCVAQENQGLGFDLNSNGQITGCTALDNTGHGIFIREHVVGRNNKCQGNGQAGLYAFSSSNHLEGNNLTGNTTGLHVNGAGNVIIKNTAAGNTTNYEIGVSNAVGAIVEAGNSSAISGSSGSGSLGSTDPWANFSY